MEGANHCYEIEMTSNYLLAANVRVCQLLCHVAPFLLLSPPPVCCGGDDEPFQMSPKCSPLPSFLNVETEKIGVVKQSLCHRGNGSCLQ